MGKEYLFVGGCLDGKRLYKEGDPICFKVAKLDNCIAMSELSISEYIGKHINNFEFDEYQLREFRFGDKIFEVFVFLEMTEEQFMEPLLENYKKVKI